jgi:thiamine biosynthesis protein ThiI
MMEDKYKYEFIVIRYGELALKGKNRKQFETQLQENIKQQMKDLNIKINRTFGRMYLFLNDEDFQVVADRLKKVFGISSFSPAIKAELELEEIKEAALIAMQAVEPRPETFKVRVRRPNKTFPHSSDEMNHHLGSHILVHTDHLKVDVHQPDVEVQVEIRDEAAYVMCQRVAGAGGLPVGTSGKVMLMLSGGIDSPVAGYLTLKRGVRFEGVHFHSYPFTSDRAKQKVIDLTKRLTTYGGNLKLHVVPFTHIQTEIRKHVPDEYSITVMRRIMLRITQGLAEKHKALGIATGENLGQVASQTLQSMHTINEVTSYPMIRPLITMDKLEIIKIAQEIGTYETSILPFEDCCTIFQPKSPKTRPSLKSTQRFEQRLNLEELIAEAIEQTESLWFSAKEKEEAEDSMDHLF